MLLVALVWLILCCFALVVVLPVVWAGRRADEQQQAEIDDAAIALQARLDRLDEIQSSSGRPFFDSSRSRGELERLLRDVVPVEQGSPWAATPS